MLDEEFGLTIARARNGEEAAFERLWRDVNPSLERYLRLIAGPAAEDVAAETWLSVVQRLGRFRGDEAAWRAWVFTTARRRALDEWRRAGRQARPSGLADAAAFEQLAPHPDSAEAAAANLDRERLLAAVRTLPRHEAEAVLLRIVVGLEPRDVAVVVGRSRGAVRVALHRGLRRLAERLYPEATPGPVPVTAGYGGPAADGRAS